MLRLCFLFLLFFLTVEVLPAQDCIPIKNPSFEEENKGGAYNGARYWRDLHHKRETPYSIMITDVSRHGVERNCPDGFRYALMVTRANHTWEAMSQKLSAPMRKGVTYQVSMWLAQDPNMMSLDPFTNQLVSFYNPVKIRLWGGKRRYKRHTILAESPTVAHTDWRQYVFTFTPDEDYKYFILEVFYHNGNATEPYYGHVLLDMVSDIAVYRPAN